LSRCFAEVGVAFQETTTGDFCALVTDRNSESSLFTEQFRDGVSDGGIADSDSLPRVS
jgi:hypothetical protein